MAPDLDPMEFARIADALQSAPTPTRTAEEIIDYVRDQLDAEHAGITLIRAHGELETVAATASMVEQLDVLQYELDEGPCRDSSWHRETLLVSDLAADRRWPRWATKAAALGVSSVLAVELTNAEDHRLGTINVYWPRRRLFTGDDIAFANIFARHAALALTQSANVAGLNSRWMAVSASARLKAS